MIRSCSSSKIMKNNTHILNQKQSPLSLHNSKTQSISKPRKMSVTSVKENIPDIDKLINDIKIAPNNSPTECVQKIMVSLKQLEKFQVVTDQVRAVTMLIQSIQKKIVSHGMAATRAKNSLRSSSVNLKKNTMDFKIYNNSQASSKKYENSHIVSPLVHQKNRSNFGIMKMSDNEPNQLNDVSPIKQMQGQSSSRIIYSNLSLRELQKNIDTDKKSEVNGQSNNKPKISISQFEEEQQSSDEIGRLNTEIKYLEDLLAKKTMSQNQTTGVNRQAASVSNLFRKKSNKY